MKNKKPLALRSPRHGQVEQVDGDPDAGDGEEDGDKDVPVLRVDLVAVLELEVGEGVSQQPGQHQDGVEGAAVAGDRVRVGVQGEEGALGGRRRKKNQNNFSVSNCSILQQTSDMMVKLVVSS